MRVFCAAVMFTLLATPALSQSQVPQYGDLGKEKTPSEIEAEKTAKKNYDNSLRNIPDSKVSVDPWGSARTTDESKAGTKPAAKTAAKTGAKADAKTSAKTSRATPPAKTGGTAN